MTGRRTRKSHISGGCAISNKGVGRRENRATRGLENVSQDKEQPEITPPSNELLLGFPDDEIGIAAFIYCSYHLDGCSENCPNNNCGLYLWHGCNGAIDFPNGRKPDFVHNYCKNLSIH